MRPATALVLSIARTRRTARRGPRPAHGSIACGVDRVNYNAMLTGVLRSGGEVDYVGSGPWRELAERVIGSRVLGGGGGNFTRV